jgi:hypothetical protein
MPTRHPFGLLKHYPIAEKTEHEQVLVYILAEGIKAGQWKAVKTQFRYPALIENGLAREIEGRYELTLVAQALLHEHYGKSEEPQTGEEQSWDIAFEFPPDFAIIRPDLGEIKAVGASLTRENKLSTVAQLNRYKDWWFYQREGRVLHYQGTVSMLRRRPSCDRS